jgi:hypothetical protein
MSILPKMRWPIRFRVGLAFACTIWPIAYSQERGYRSHEREFHGNRALPPDRG